MSCLCDLHAFMLVYRKEMCILLPPLEMCSLNYAMVSPCFGLAVYFGCFLLIAGC